jgi:hypothetical protein
MYTDVLSVAITAPTVLNMNVTEGFIEAAASIANAQQQLTAQRSKASSHNAVAATTETTAVVTDTEVLSQYWIRNDTGTALTYSTDGVEVELYPGGEAALNFKLKQSATSRSTLEHWLDSNGDSIMTASDTTANTAAAGSSNSSNSPSSASMLLSPTVSGTGSTSRSVTLCMPAYSGDGSIWRTVQPVSAEREGSRVITLKKSRAIGDISSSYADLMQQSPSSSPKQRSSKSTQHQQPQQQQQQQQGGAVVRVIATVETRGGVKLLSIKSPAHITNSLRGVSLHIALHTNQMKVGSTSSSVQQSPTPNSGLASPTKRKALPLWDCIVPPRGSIVIPATIAAAASFQGAVYTVKPMLQQQQAANGGGSATNRYRAVSFELPQQETDPGSKECGAHFKSLKFDADSDFTSSSSSGALSSVVCIASVRRGSGGDIPTVNSTNITSQSAVVPVVTGLQLAFLPPLTVTNLLAAPADLKLSQPEVRDTSYYTV